MTLFDDALADISSIDKELADSQYIDKGIQLQIEATLALSRSVLSVTQMLATIEIANRRA